MLSTGARENSTVYKLKRNSWAAILCAGILNVIESEISNSGVNEKNILHWPGVCNFDPIGNEKMNSRDKRVNKPLLPVWNSSRN